MHKYRCYEGKIKEGGNVAVAVAGNQNQDSWFKPPVLYHVAVTTGQPFSNMHA